LNFVAWRIAVETPTYPANDMTGTGAKMSGGRWNSAGIPMVYSSANIALAALETLSYVRTAGLPFNRFLVRLDFPDDVWVQRTILDPLPGGWDAIPSGITGKRIGDSWIANATSAILVVPSVIITEEQNILVNPAHPASAKIVATTVKRFVYDPRFF
jgi:RES domain-containing protein